MYLIGVLIGDIEAIVCANIVLITGKIRYAIYLHMAFNLFGAIILGYIPIGRYTIIPFDHHII